MSTAATASSSLAETDTPTVAATPVVTEAPPGSYSELSNGGIAGIAVGSTVGAIMLFGLLFLWFKRISRLRSQRAQAGLEWHTGGQPYHREHPLSAGYQPAHCYNSPIQAVALPAVELPATTNEDEDAITTAEARKESPCLGIEKSYAASGMTFPLQARQSRLFELEDPSTQHAVTKRQD